MHPEAHEPPVLSFRQPRRQPVSSPRAQGDRRRSRGASAPRTAAPAPLPAFGSPRAAAGSAVPGQAETSRLSERAGARRSRPTAPSPLQPFGGAPDPQPRLDPFSAPPTEQPAQRKAAGLAVFSTDGELRAISQDRRELVCSLIGLTLKLGLVAVTGVSLVRIAGAYQQRMDSNGEIVAVLELEKARLHRARERFDGLFMVEGEQRLIREQSQWIAPNRLRVIWQSAEAAVRPERRP